MFAMAASARDATVEELALAKAERLAQAKAEIQQLSDQQVWDKELNYALLRTGKVDLKPMQKARRKVAAGEKPSSRGDWTPSASYKEKAAKEHADAKREVLLKLFQLEHAWLEDASRAHQLAHEDFGAAEQANRGTGKHLADYVDEEFDQALTSPIALVAPVVPVPDIVRFWKSSKPFRLPGGRVFVKAVREEFVTATADGEKFFECSKKSQIFKKLNAGDLLLLMQTQSQQRVVAVGEVAHPEVAHPCECKPIDSLIDNLHMWGSPVLLFVHTCPETGLARIAVAPACIGAHAICLCYPLLQFSEGNPLRAQCKSFRYLPSMTMCRFKSSARGFEVSFSPHLTVGF